MKKVDAKGVQWGCGSLEDISGRAVVVKLDTPECDVLHVPYVNALKNCEGSDVTDLVNLTEFTPASAESGYKDYISKLHEDMFDTLRGALKRVRQRFIYKTLYCTGKGGRGRRPPTRQTRKRLRRKYYR